MPRLPTTLSDAQAGDLYSHALDAAEEQDIVATENAEATLAEATAQALSVLEVAQAQAYATAASDWASQSNDRGASWRRPSWWPMPNGSPPRPATRPTTRRGTPPRQEATTLAPVAQQTDDTVADDAMLGKYRRARRRNRSPTRNRRTRRPGSTRSSRGPTEQRHRGRQRSGADEVYIPAEQAADDAAADNAVTDGANTGAAYLACANGIAVAATTLAGEVPTEIVPSPADPYTAADLQQWEARFEDIFVYNQLYQKYINDLRKSEVLKPEFEFKLEEGLFPGSTRRPGLK